MPLILWRHLLAELGKVLGITTGIIVTVIAFGLTAKTMADNIIGVEMVPKYLALAIIPMMQYALPFAAGFAATLVMHRFVSDNEITAMSACGMSYRRILTPVIIMGVLLAAVMAGIVTVAAPLLWTQMKKLGAADATQLLVAAVERGEALKFDNTLIYADRVEVVPVPADIDAQRRLVLHGVAAIELQKGPLAVPVTEFTAESAAVDVYLLPTGSVAKMVLNNATIYRPGDGAIASVPRAEPEASAIGSEFYRSPKFLPLDELLALRANVDLDYTVQAKKRQLAAKLGASDLWQCLVQQESSGVYKLEQPGMGREFRIEGARLRQGELVPAAREGTLTVTELLRGAPARRTLSTSVVLKAVSEAGFQPAFSMTVSAPQQTRDLRENTPARWPPRVDDLVPVGCNRTDWSSRTSFQVLDGLGTIPATDRRAPFQAVAAEAEPIARRLREAQRDVRDESDSHIAQRGAQCVSVALVLLLGAMLAMWLRRALPLTIYVLAFLPAIANVMMVAGGQQVMRDGYFALGLSLMWGGNGLLAAALAWSGWKVARN